LLDHCERLQSLTERVELLHGGIEPAKVAERHPNCAKSKKATTEKEKGKMLAVAFVEGADKCFKPLLSDLEQGCLLGDGKHPDAVEEALQVLSLHEQQTLKRMVKKKPKSEDEAPLVLSFAQNRKCWHCGQPDHVKKDCPKKKAGGEDTEAPEQSHFQQGWHGSEHPRGWAGWCAQSLAATTFVQRSVLAGAVAHNLMANAA